MEEKISLKSEKVKKVSFSNCGKRIIELADNLIRLYDFTSKKIVYEKEINTDFIDFYYYNEKLFLIYKNQVIILEENTNESKIINLDIDLYLIKVVFSKKITIVVDTEDKITLFDIESFEKIKEFEGHDSKILSMDISREETYIITSSEKEIKMWDIKFLSIEGKAINPTLAKHYIKSKKAEDIELIHYKPIGFLKCNQQERYEVPRQGIHAKNSMGYIQLTRGSNFEQATKDLEGIERLWIIYHFHINDGWKPQVSPPRFLERKIGVFATRSPFRPNAIGISCVKLEKVETLKIYISEFDILNKTPILDIKPYIPYADSFPDSKTGWLKIDTNVFVINLSDLAKKQNKWLIENGDVNVENYAKVQLQFTPDNTERLRILDSGYTLENQQIYFLKFRTWLIEYFIDFEKNEVFILKILSFYLYNDTINKNEKMKDLDLHKKYIECFYN